MLRDVRHEITDGLLGITSYKGEGVHVKIGASPVESSSFIIITGNMTAQKIKERLGLSPLADKTMDSVENGSARVLCIPVKASIAGSIINKNILEDGKAKIELTGSPTNAFEIIVKITGTGKLNEAAFVYSIDGGYKYSDEITVPISGEYEIAETGIKLTFSVPDNTAFEKDSIFKFETTAPLITNKDVLNAIERLKTVTEEYEFVHVVGECDRSIWSAISTQQQILMETYHKPMFFVLEAYKPNIDEKVEDYAFRLEADAKTIKNRYIQVVAARSIYNCMDGITREINNAGIVSGLYAKTAVNRSIGETAEISISTEKMHELRPAGIEEYIEILDNAKFLTFRQYDGLDGFYVTNAKMLCADDSDYRYAEDIRVSNKIVKKTRRQALLLLQSDIDMANIDAELAAMGEFIQAPLDDMVSAGEISSVAIEIPENQDILVDETLHVIIRYVPRGKIREIVIDLGVSNITSAAD